MREWDQIASAMIAKRLPGSLQAAMSGVSIGNL
jgi:hypothetical protein